MKDRTMSNTKTGLKHYRTINHQRAQISTKAAYSQNVSSCSLCNSETYLKNESKSEVGMQFLKNVWMNNLKNVWMQTVNSQQYNFKQALNQV